MSTDAKSDAVQPPKHLHKYLDCYGLDAIYNLELKITPPNEFNDPFEFTPRLSNAESERIIIHRRTTKIAEKLGVNASQAQRAEIERQMRLGGPSEFRDAASRQFVVLCLSAKADIATQWAHYSDKHTGLVLELDTNAEVFQKYLSEPLGSKRLLFPVRYCCTEEKREQKLQEAIQDMQAGQIESLLQVLLGCAAEKSLEWHLEREHRLIVSLKKTEQELNNGIESKLINGKTLYFLKISAGAIKRVILGAKATLEFELEIRKAAANSGISDDQIVRAQLDHQSLSVLIPSSNP